MRRTCRRTDQPKVSRQSILKNVMDIGRSPGVFRVIVGALQIHLAILQHLQHFIHLDGVKLPNFIDEQNAAVRLRNRSWLWLRYSRNSHCTGPLVYWIMNRSNQRIGNASFVKSGNRGIHLDKFGVCLKRGYRIFFRFLHHYSGRSRLAHSWRPVNNYMLRIGTA
ncbi:hypothetical protein D3C77_407520 [compost metagenome]